MKSSKGDVSGHCFGVYSAVFSTVWKLSGDNHPHDSQLWHSLWALLFLKVYATEHVNAAIVGADGNTFRKWSRRFLKLITDLKVVSTPSKSILIVLNEISDAFWIKINCENRYSEDDDLCNISDEGTDCSIFEPTPFSPRWYYHKLKGPSLRYEVGVSIGQVHIAWVHGPWPCGTFPDLKMFRIETKGALYEEDKMRAKQGRPCLSRIQISSTSGGDLKSDNGPELRH